MENQNLNEEKITERRELNKKFDALGWGLFFIWVGIAYLSKFEVGITLLGVGIITLSVQMIRKLFKLNFEGFWIIVGSLFVIGGLWELFEPKLSLIPILLIVAGFLVLTSIVWGKRRMKN